MRQTNGGSLWGLAIGEGASDLHAAPGHRPMLRIDGLLQALSGDPLTDREVVALLGDCLTEEQRGELEERGTLECAYQTESGERFRISAQIVEGKHVMSARLIPSSVPTLESVRMPDVVVHLCRKRHGLVIFTGPSGCGKSTSMAAILAAVMSEIPLHVVTLEDPVEFRFESGGSLVSQRELGADFHSFSAELGRLLRQDADIVMVGEMRDLESMRNAITLAETGHLVMTTLHTADAVQTIHRIVANFPAHEQNLVRNRLASTLTAIVAQQLLPKVGGGRVANREILVRTNAVSNLIREDRMLELRNVLETNAEVGMTTFARDLQRLVGEGLVEPRLLPV